MGPRDGHIVTFTATAVATTLMANRAMKVNTTVSFTALPGTAGSRTSFLWTVGGGLQYQLTPSSTIEVYYQYVDAGKFRTGNLEGPGIAEEGNLRTHRIGAAISLNLSYLAQLVAGR